MLRGNLERNFESSAVTSAMETCAVPDEARPETVGIEQWRCLASKLS
jgi:hypothetical protein